jgi:hypothetical protein
VAPRAAVVVDRRSAMHKRIIAMEAAQMCSTSGVRMVRESFNEDW